MGYLQIIYLESLDVSNQPANQPTYPPTHQPTNPPSHPPTHTPINQPTDRPTDDRPTYRPTGRPTNQTTSKTTNKPTFLYYISVVSFSLTKETFFPLVSFKFLRNWYLCFVCILFRTIKKNENINLSSNVVHTI